MRGKMSTDMGEIIIDKDVLAKYAGAATTECIGIVGMASVNVKDGVTKLLKRESAGRGVNISIVDNKIKIELHIIVAYGVSIRAVSQNVIENVKYKIEEFTGMDVESINVIVEGVRIIDADSLKNKLEYLRRRTIDVKSFKIWRGRLKHEGKDV